MHLKGLGGLLGTVLKELYGTEDKAQATIRRELREPEGFRG